MSWGLPSRASTRRASAATSAATSASIGALGRCPAGDRLAADHPLVRRRLCPTTSRSPRPRTAFTTAVSRSPVTGSALKATPAASAATIGCTSTAIRASRRTPRDAPVGGHLAGERRGPAAAHGGRQSPRPARRARSRTARRTRRRAGPRPPRRSAPPAARSPSRPAAAPMAAATCTGSGTAPTCAGPRGAVQPGRGQGPRQRLGREDHAVGHREPGPPQLAERGRLVAHPRGVRRVRPRPVTAPGRCSSASSPPPSIRSRRASGWSMLPAPRRSRPIRPPTYSADHGRYVSLVARARAPVPSGSAPCATASPSRP